MDVSLEISNVCAIIYHKMNKFELILRGRMEDVRDEVYGDFVSRLIPEMKRGQILGVRVPEIRSICGYALGEIFGRAKGWSLMDSGQLTRAKSNGFNVELYHEMNKFLADLPHSFLEYDYAHAEIISRVNNFSECVSLVEEFLPYVNNWAVCDTLNPKVFRKNSEELLVFSLKWMESERAFTTRFGMGVQMRYFLDEKFSSDLMEKVVAVAQRAERDWTGEEQYYVRMMVAWYFATALCKQWEAAVAILAEEKLPIWTHNKAIQKAIESRRITLEQKDFLRGLKRV